MNLYKNIIQYFRNTYLELKKVEWLSRKLTFRYTWIVIVFLILGTIFVFGVDQALNLARRALILQNL